MWQLILLLFIQIKILKGKIGNFFSNSSMQSQFNSHNSRLFPSFSQLNFTLFYSNHTIIIDFQIDLLIHIDFISIRFCKIQIHIDFHINLQNHELFIPICKIMSCSIHTDFISIRFSHNCRRVLCNSFHNFVWIWVNRLSTFIWVFFQKVSFVRLSILDRFFMCCRAIDYCQIQ